MSSVSRETAVVLVVFFFFCSYYWITNTINPPEGVMPDPAIVEMISKISESKIYDIVYDLQNLSTRKYGHPGNTEAGTYLFERLSNMSGLDVEYQGENIRNVIATLQGTDESSNAIYIVGAHYDSTSLDPSDAPGATDNGGGVAIVLELARIMSQYKFKHTLKFAFWDGEEDGLLGSRNYADYCSANALNISLYFNYDSACYDPDNRMVLDIMTNLDSHWVSVLMTQHNSLFGIEFTLTYNVHGCGSDYRSFWEHGYTAVTTHEETHGPAHTAKDTVNKISTTYAKKNGQLGMSVLAKLAEVQSNILQ